MPLTPPEVVRVAPQEALAIRGVLTTDEIAGFFDTVFDEVASTAERAGLVLAGPPFGFYPEMPAERIVVEAGFPVSGPAATDGRVHRLVLPGGDVVVATHLGGYDTLAQSYEELTRWMQEQQLQPGPCMWESYTSDPAAEPDPSRWRTVLHCPLAAPGEGGPTGE